MRKNDLCRLAIILVAMLGLLTLVQTDVSAVVTGKIAGTIVDAQTKEPLPGVNVMVEGTTLGAASAPNGSYFILGVPPGVYTVTASIIGYTKLSTSDVRVMVDRTTTVNFSVKSTAIESKEGVTVTAERPTIIRDLTATATHSDAQVFQSAPVQDTRDIINLTAGVLRDTDGNIYIRGGESNQLKFYVDGVSMEQLDTREFGMRNTERYQTAKFNFNILGVQEMEVVTGGFNAEYGDAQSGVVNVVTKEGGGAYHGEFRVEMSPGGKFHYGPYLYDHEQQLVFREWQDFSKWTTWNNGLSNPAQWRDSLAGWYKKWTNVVNPSPGHRGGVYDYRNQGKYERAVWGVGGPIVGNKVTFFFSGELRQRPSLVPSAMKYFNYANLDFTVTYRINPKMKLKLKSFYSYHQDALWANEQNIYDNNSMTWLGVWPRFFAYTERPTNGQSIVWTHTVSPTTFYEILVSAIRDQKKGTDMDQGYPNALDWWVPNGPYVGRFIYPWGGNYSENGVDADQKNVRYRADLTTQIDAHNQLKVGSEGRIYGGYNFSSHRSLNFANANWNASAYHLTPHYFSGYLQDKMEYGGMIANIGGRIDYYDVNKPSPVDKFNPGYAINSVAIRGNFATRPNKTWAKISPRLGFSHPVSENTAFHFQYGHFYQAPELATVNNYGLYSNGFQYYPNPDLAPGKTVSYEFGLQHNLRGTHRLNVVVYFNDLSDQAWPVRYYMPLNGNQTDRNFTPVYENIQYGTAKGVEFTIDRTGVGKWYYRVTYTMARTFYGRTGVNEKWSADPMDPMNWSRRQDNRSFLRGTDRTHRITGMLSFRSPQDWGKLWGNWEANLDVQVQTGRPLTYTMSYEEELTLNGNRRFPIEQLTDLTIKKVLNVFTRVRPQLFIRVSNLFNNQWFRYDGGQTAKDWLQKNSIWADWNTAKNWYDNSNYPNSNFRSFYNEARRYYFGLGFDF